MFELDTDVEVDMDGFEEYVAKFIDKVGPDNELGMGIDELRDAYVTVTVARRTAEQLNEFIVQYVKDVFNSPGEHMEMDLDDVYTRYIITDKKKKYAGHVVYDDGPCAYSKIKGFKCIKANTCDAIEQFQKQLISAELNQEPTDPIVRDFRSRLFNGRFDEEMVQHTRLNQMPDEYDTLMAHARAARQIIEREGDKGAVRTGDKIAHLKYGDETHQVQPVDNGIDDFRPNDYYCPECNEVVIGDHKHETDDGPRLRSSHYSYLWDNRFQQTLDLLQLNLYTQTGIGDFATA
jgi:hypothetical protein